MTTKATLLALVAAVNGTVTLTATAKLDFLGADAPAASVQQLPGARWLSRYADNSGIHELPFAVLLRTAGNDTAGRADAAAELYALGAALEAASPVSGLGIVAGVDTPSLVERDDHGQETWRTSFVLESEVTSG